MVCAWHISSADQQDWRTLAVYLDNQNNISGSVVMARRVSFFLQLPVGPLVLSVFV